MLIKVIIKIKIKIIVFEWKLAYSMSEISRTKTWTERWKKRDFNYNKFIYDTS